VLALVGALLGVDSFWGVAALGTGSSLIAAALFTWLYEFREGFTQAILAQGLMDLFPSRFRRFDEAYWPELVGSTRDHFKVLGVANHGYMGTADAEQQSREAIRAAVERGVVVEILWLDPDSSMAEARDLQEKRGTRRDIVDAIDWFWRLRDGLGEQLQNRLTLLEHRAIPACGLTWADEQLIVTHYIAGQNNLDSPGMILSTSSIGSLRSLYAWRGRPQRRRAALAQAYMRTYAQVRKNASEIDGARVGALRQKRAGWDTAEPSETDLRKEELEEGAVIDES
jgi:hypothetical protein